MKNEYSNKIITLSMLVEKGVKIARLKGNRNINDKVIKAKMTSMKQNGMLIPGVIVDAEKAIEAGMEIVDFETEEDIDATKGKQYAVLVDANHRYQAHLNLLKKNEGLREEEQYKGEFYLIYALNDNLAISEMLTTINVCTDPWKGGDFTKGAKMVCKKPLPLLDFIDKLIDEGYPLPTASKWATFKSDITKKVMADAMVGKISEKLQLTKGLERGEKLLEAARKSLSKDVLKSRNLIDWIIFKYDEASDEQKTTIVNQMVDFFSNLDREKTKQIEKAKGVRGGDTKETIINHLLNDFYKEFEQSQNALTDEQSSNASIDE